MIRPMPDHQGRPKMTRLPELLSAHLKAHSMTVADVAEYTGVSHRQADRWLRGDSEPGRNSQHDLAEMLGVSPIDFYEPGVFTDIPVTPGLYEEIRAALTDIGDVLREIRDALASNRQDLSLLVGSLVPGLAERVQDLVSQLDPQAQAEETSEEEQPPPRRLGEGKGPNGA